MVGFCGLCRILLVSMSDFTEKIIKLIKEPNDIYLDLNSVGNLFDNINRK